jgi:hypothetical protein
MTSREEIISKLLSQEEWFELFDESAVELFNILIKNKNIMDNLLKYYTFINDDKNSINTKIINWQINMFENSIKELVDGLLSFEGSCTVIGFDDKLRLKIKVENFKIYEVWAIDMYNDTEIAFVKQDKYVKRMEKEIFRSSPGVYNSRYKYIFRGNV